MLLPGFVQLAFVAEAGQASPSSAAAEPPGGKTSPELVDRANEVQSAVGKLVEQLPSDAARLLRDHAWGLVWVAIVMLAALVIGRVARFFLRRLAARLESRNKLIRAAALRSLDAGVMFVALAAGLNVGLMSVVAGGPYEDETRALTGLLFVFAGGYVLYRLVDVVDAWLSGMAAKTPSRLDDMMIPLVRTTLRATIVVLVLLTATETVLHRPVSAILAGLGVGGIAVGLAAQDTVKNFFGSIMLFSDRPFEMGDRVVVDGHDGPVESVGFRSTRIRTLEGHLVTVPNGELANKTILNIGKRPNIRRVMNLGITYDTPPEKVTRAKQILSEILANHEGMQADLPPRVCFNDFKDSSLNLLVIYWYHPPDYWAYAAFSERVNFEILRRFNEEGIEFAFPTQSLFLAKDPSRPLWEGSPDSSA